MKKVKFLLILIVLISLTSTPIFAESQISVIVNGKYLSLDVPPIIIEGRTMVPVRAIFEALGSTPYWNNETRTVTAQTSSNSIRLTIDSNIAVVNNKMVVLDVPAKLIEGRTMVPVRFIAESLGANVSWDNSNRTVVIQANIIISKSWGDGYYIGESINDIPNGKGTQTWSNGDKYVGEFSDGSRNGYGIYTKLDGSIIDGEWEEGYPINANFYGPAAVGLNELARISKENQDNKIIDNTTNKTSETNNNDKLSDYKNKLLKRVDYLIDEFESIRDNIFTNLEEYERVYENELYIAQIDIDKEKENVYKQAFQEYERTKLLSSELGIGNSAQMEGLLNSAKAKYDTIINDIDTSFDEYKKELTNWRNTNQEPLKKDLLEVDTYIEELEELRNDVLNSDSFQELIDIEGYLY